MPRPAPYTRSRRTLMQVVMWLTFGATVGVAALIGGRQTREVRLGNLRVQLPSGWHPSLQPTRGGGLALTAVEGGGRRPGGPADRVGRTLVVSERPLAAGEPVTEFLRREIIASTGVDLPENREIEPLEIAGHEGLLVQVRPAEALGGEPIGWNIFAAAYLPTTRTAVLVQLVGVDDPTEADREAVRRIAGGITLAPPPRLQQ